ncbi:MAG: DUF3526 domain-containing protein [Pseudomonadales bacterium]
MSMNVALLIAKEEWRYWGRSRLGVTASIAALVLVIASIASTAQRINAEQIERAQFQQTATDTFQSQPARHPHRMVHYGHYVLRTPAPLAVLDPGVDAFAGTMMFLECHRQNSAVFSPRYSAAQAGPFAQLTPAFAYQVLVPLLLIIIGFSALSREHEAKTASILLASSITPLQLWYGKTLALIAAALFLLLPLALALLYAMARDESALIGIVFLAGYALYLIFWCFLISGFSALARRSSSALAYQLAAWVLLVIITPRLAATAADVLSPVDGKIATDLKIAEAIRQIGDGHNAEDPAFTKLKNELLEQYEVDDIAKLPINFRGVVAQYSEAKLTDVLNEFAQRRMDQELRQTRLMHFLGVLSPTLATRSFSTATASTDLWQYHRFLNEAEALRFDFVQKLNAVHIGELDYHDDMNRGANAAASQKARVSADNWRVLEDFSWQPGNTGERILRALPHTLLLIFWCAVTGFLSARITQQILGNHDG